MTKTPLQTWLPRALYVIAIAAVVHTAAVAYLPTGVMNVLFRRFPAEFSRPDAPERLVRAPMADETMRGITMPSPDLLYSTCIYDLTQAPLRIRADPKLDTYWSVAFYAGNTDNFLVVNDRTAAGNPVDILLVSASGEAAPKRVPDGARVVIAPTTKGMVLIRMLAPDYAEQKEKLEAARQRLSCTYWKN
jgi:uncharacterized membrane protein